jgi:hypothetical protein
VERIVIDRRAAALQRHAVAIREQHAAADIADREIQPVEALLRGMKKRAGAFPYFAQARFGQALGGTAFGRVEMMKRRRPTPGGDQSGLCGFIGSDCQMDAIGVVKTAARGHVFLPDRHQSSSDPKSFSIFIRV